MSCIISTNTPPSPTITIAPKRASRVVPTISSTPARAIGCTATPSKRASGIFAARFRRICSNASRTSASFARSSSTPPTSLLWLTSGDITFSATGKPIFLAALAAASALAATSGTVTGKPSAWIIRLLSISLSNDRPLDRADAIVDEIKESLTLSRIAEPTNYLNPQEPNP